ncbi:MAG TPA: Mur ligase family protein [Chitinophagales bacterium]|nr:Mur ligase family protein [Chitinophagales bacterium]
MRVHFIAIGGSVMHNLAIALALKGYDVSGSDDEIFEPAKSNLSRYNLLPETLGWNPSIITSDIDAVLLGMHAKADNPELLRAQKLGLKIFSFPEFLHEQSKNKTRVVIGGSHGKTSITAMVMHILKKNDRDFDYMVGSAVKGFDITVRLSDSAPVIILEGDEYPDSAINQTPKFLIYQPNIALISGIAWDHINMFPTFESYIEQFRKFVELIPFDGTLIFNSEDETVKRIAETANTAIKKIGYATPSFEIANGKTFFIHHEQKIPLEIFGRHNLQNMMGAVEVCKCLGVEEENCLAAMEDFSGAAKRLELVIQNETCSVFRDFAHAPSKLKATIAAVKEQFPRRKLVACFELHTFSSLNQDFLTEYFGSLQEADIKIIFCNAHTFELKRMQPLDPSVIKKSFGDQAIHVFTGKEGLRNFLAAQSWNEKNLLMMSSGNFGEMDLNEIATFVTSHS